MNSGTASQCILRSNILHVSYKLNVLVRIARKSQMHVACVCEYVTALCLALASPFNMLTLLNVLLVLITYGLMQTSQNGISQQVYPPNNVKNACITRCCSRVRRASPVSNVSLWFFRMKRSMESCSMSYNILANVRTEISSDTSPDCLAKDVGRISH